MITAAQCQKKFGVPGTPEANKHLVLWDVPAELEIGVIPKRIYCHKLMIVPLTNAFKNLISTGCVDELKTWDGCYNIREKKGNKSLSIHSWALAIDCNAAWNGWKKKPTLSARFVQCFKDAGFDWGGDWKTTPDGMHFQLKTI